MSFMSTSGTSYPNNYVYQLHTPAADVNRFVSEKEVIVPAGDRQQGIMAAGLNWQASPIGNAYTNSDGCEIQKWHNPENVTSTKGAMGQVWHKVYVETCPEKQVEVAPPAVENAQDLTNANVGEDSYFESFAKDYLPGYRYYAAVRDGYNTYVDPGVQWVNSNVVEPVAKQLPEGVKDGIKATVYIGTPLFLIYFLFFKRTTVNVNNTIVIDDKALQGRFKAQEQLLKKQMDTVLRQMQNRNPVVVANGAKNAAAA